MISTKGRYALRTLADIAEQGRDAPVRLCEVARRQGISEKYLQHVARLLVDAGLLVGTSGRGGGYRLAKPAGDITAREALEAAEGTLAPVACLVPGAPPCELAPRCKTLSLWRRYDELTRGFFGGVSIADLAEGGADILSA